MNEPYIMSLRGERGEGGGEDTISGMKKMHWEIKRSFINWREAGLGLRRNFLIKFARHYPSTGLAHVKSHNHSCSSYMTFSLELALSRFLDSFRIRAWLHYFGRFPNFDLSTHDLSFLNTKLIRLAWSNWNNWCNYVDYLNLRGFPFSSPANSRTRICETLISLILRSLGHLLPDKLSHFVLLKARSNWP